MIGPRDRARSIRRTAFEAFTTTIELIGVEIGERALREARAYGLELAEDWNATFSRFRPDSEISRLNAANGAVTRVSEDLYWLLACAKDAWASTGGRFDPTVLPALEAAGYDRDIVLVQGAGMAAAGDVTPAPGMGGVMLDPAGLTVRLPAGARIDLGGIAKGAFVDRLATALMTWPGGCVNAGGDLRVWGTPPGGPFWLVGIEDPLMPGSDRLQVEIHDARAGCVATSTTVKRRWPTVRGAAHHLIDPATGAPARGALRSCSVLAASAVQAEIGAKALFMAAAHGESPRLMDCAAAVLIDRVDAVDVIPGGAPDACAFPAAAAIRQPA